MHPMVTLQNVKRRTYVHTTDSGDKMNADEIIPWGDDAVIGIIFNDNNGTYSIQSNTGGYLSSTGMLTTERAPDGSNDFVIEFHGGVVAFKNKKSHKYLTSLGSEGLCKATKSSVTAHEKYEMHNSYPQVTLQSFNKKFVSVKQGVELAATAKAADSDQEIFQLAPLDNGNWTVTASTKGSHAPEDWTLTPDGAIKSKSDEAGNKEFAIEFHGTKVAFKAGNGKYIAQQKVGYLKATGDEPTGESLFEFELINRPRLVLRGFYGFINTLPSGLLQCKHSLPEFYQLTTSAEGVAICNDNGKFWQVTDTGITAAGDVAQYYTIELYKNSKLTINHGGALFKSSQNGDFTATGSSGDKFTLMEY